MFMHKSEIPALVQDYMAKLGPVRCYALDPPRTAHVIIDLQNGFCAEGAIAEVPLARAIVPNVNRICAALRAAGGLNVFVRFTVDPQEPQCWTSWHEHQSEEARAALGAAFAPGALPHQLWPTLDVRPEDLVLDKTRLSALIPGTCALHETLKQRGIEALIVTGTLSNLCCESTARDAMQMGYKVFFVQDGNATWDDSVHNATLGNMAMVFADVVSTEALVARLTG
jgi:ureidoacrylate peracid hydrolase